MKNPLFPVVLAVFGGVLYHLSQKSVPKTVSPFAAILCAYAIGIALCAAAFWLEPAAQSFGASLRESNWAVIGVGVSAVLIEIGVLLAYRTGWNISVASVTINIVVALALIPVGLVAYKEHLSARNAAGIVCCLIGLYLISKK